MDASQLPAALPETVSRPRPLIETVLTLSLREEGPDSRTSSAWRWVLTGQGPSPVSGAPGPGRPPAIEDIVAEARWRGTAERWWPPWRADPDDDRRQARRVLRWLTGAADAIPLSDPARGRFVGARLHFAHSDQEIRLVRGWAQHGLDQHGELPERMSRWEAEHPWQWPSWWMNAAWLHGTIAFLDWILGDRLETPVTFKLIPIAPPDLFPPPECPPTAEDITREMVMVGGVVMQGHEHQPPAEPDDYPPPQWGEAVEQAHEWLIGEDTKPPADHHGCGGYYPCPGMRRCSCEAAGYCLRGQCPACTDKICNAGWSAIEVRH
jgi:hypothetical protein